MNHVDNIYKNTDEYDLNKKRKILIVFDDMISDMLNSNTLNRIVTKLFIRGRKLNFSVIFITKSYFPKVKNIRLNSTHYFTMKALNQRELRKLQLIIHQILNLSSHSSLVSNVTLTSDNPLSFRRNLLERI